MSSWREVALGEICELRYGKALAASERDGSGYPVYGSNGPVGAHSFALTDGPTVVIGRKGSYGEVAYSATACWPIDTTYYIDNRATASDLKWLSYRLGGLGLKGLNRAAAVPGLNRDDAYRQRLLLPPLDEQRRIAAILDKADEIRTKRREALSHLDTIPRSVFEASFGSVLAEATVDGVSVNARTGPFGSQLLHSEFVDDGVAVLGLDNVVGNEFRWAERRFITSAKYEQLKRYTVHPGDVLISIMGTTGRCVVVPDDIPLTINTKHICAITLNVERILPSFVRAAFLWHRESRAHLVRQTKGSIMDGLNMGIIKAMPIPTPPLELQREFAAKMAAVATQRAAVERALAVDDELFASLQSRAFRGEL